MPLTPELDTHGGEICVFRIVRLPAAAESRGSMGAVDTACAVRLAKRIE